MDLSVLQKINEMVSEGRSKDEIKQTLLGQGISPENVTEALKEANTSDSSNAPPAQHAPIMHHEKIIQPSPGFDPSKVN